MLTNQSTQVDVNVVKSPIDHRQYEAFVLPNGLKVLVISDQQTDMAAAALFVNVGQFSDPFERQGLAHFLEHMLFMGTAKYPDVDAYRNYIQQHGGSSNAGTGQEHTGYHFSIDKKFLLGALERFAQFFISPLLDPKYVQQERKAVHSEYMLKIKEDSRRIREVRRKTSNPSHPFYKFSVGNNATLADFEKRPIWDDLKEFYDAEYSAERMTLSVLGAEDTETLKQMVCDLFSAVPNARRAKRPTTEQPFLPEQLATKVNIIPLAEIRSLRMQFPLPADLSLYKKHPVEMLTFLLGHEGAGSLFSHLKESGWAEALYTSDQGSEDHVLFTVRVTLTEHGLVNWEQVVNATFQYISLMKESSDLSRYYSEKKQISNINFQFQEPSRPVQSVRAAAYRMMYYPQQHVLNLSTLYDEYDDNLINEYLSLLTPDNLRVILVAPGLETNQVEPLYDTPYAISPLSQENKDSWSNTELIPSLHLPKPNRFIAANIQLKPKLEASSKPSLLLDENGVQLWHLQDPSFAVPRSRIYFGLHSVAANQNKTSRVSNQMFSLLLNDSLQEMAYPLQLAGLSFSVNSTWRGLQLYVAGYSEKQAALVADIALKIREFSANEKRFAIQKTRLIRSYKNRKTRRPINQVEYQINELINPKVISAEQALKALESLTFTDFQQFIAGYFQAGRLECMIHGNHRAEEAKQLVNETAGVLLAGMTIVDDPEVEINKMPPAKRHVFTVEVDHHDSVFWAYYQGETTDIVEQAKYLLLSHVLRTSFFTELRTNQQLGYLVWSFYDRIDRVPGLSFAIQSPVASPDVLENKVNRFLEDFYSTFSQNGSQDFTQRKQGVVAILTEKDNDLYDRSQRLERDLMLGYTDFDRNDQLVAAIENISHEDIVAFYQERLLSATVGRIVGRSFGSSVPKDVALGEPLGLQHILSALPAPFTRKRR